MQNLPFGITVLIWVNVMPIVIEMQVKLLFAYGVRNKIRQEWNKVYQTEVSSTAVQTLKEVMEDTEATASARIAAARTSLELAGDIGKHSQSQRNYEQNLAEMTPEELSAIIDRWEGEKAALAKDITPTW